MANEKNLIPNDARTPSERRVNAQKAGKASGASRRAKKEQIAVILNFLSLPLKKGDISEIQSLADAQGANLTVNEAIVNKSGIDFDKDDIKEKLRPLSQETGYRTIKIPDLVITELKKRKKINRFLFKSNPNMAKKWKNYVCIGERGNVKSQAVLNK